MNINRLLKAARITLGCMLLSGIGYAQKKPIIDSLPFDIVIGNNMAGSVNPKTANTFLGFRAAYVNTTGNHSTGIGSGALFSNTTGTHNTALGVSTLRFNTVGSRNTAIGMGVMRYNISGYCNTGTGNDAIRYNTTGYENTADGAFALDSNTTGYYNTAVGAYALRYNVAGVRNTALGHNAFSKKSISITNSTAIGANTMVTGSNQVRIGDVNVTRIVGEVNFSTVSDKRFVTEVTYDGFQPQKGGVPGLEFIAGLKPVTYRMHMGSIAAHTAITESVRDKEAERAREAIRYTGFIAQDVETLARELGFDFSGIDRPTDASDYYSLRYAEFVVPLVKAVQEQQLIIESLRQEISAIKAALPKKKNKSTK
ncbi:MAG: tail fiber domain-containing protein [Flavipsychrobacter sp.]|nr:tail fiber domain-containing protein [Flavipsychrobacter sp.]